MSHLAKKLVLGYFYRYGLPTSISKSKELNQSAKTKYINRARKFSNSATVLKTQLRLLLNVLIGHAFKLGISSDQDGRTTRILQFLTLRFK